MCVIIVESSLLFIEIVKENTVPTNVTFRLGITRLVTAMNNNLLHYLSAMSIAKNMLVKGLISKEEYAIFDTMMCEKYGISLCSLYRDISLIYTGLRGNM